MKGKEGKGSATGEGCLSGGIGGEWRGKGRQAGRSPYKEGIYNPSVDQQLRMVMVCGRIVGRIWRALAGDKGEAGHILKESGPYGEERVGVWGETSIDSNDLTSQIFLVKVSVYHSLNFRKEDVVKKTAAIAAVTVLLCAGCAAKPLTPAGQTVKIVREKPHGDCRELGDVVGTQGNWVTGGYTSNKNLVEGSMNDMRNQAGNMGATHIWIHQVGTNTGMSGYTENSLAVGTALQCK